MKLHGAVKWVAIGGAAYVAWRLFQGRSLSEIFTFGGQSARGREANGATMAIGGRNMPLANTPVASAGPVSSGDGGKGYVGALGPDGIPWAPPAVSDPLTGAGGFAGFPDWSS